MNVQFTDNGEINLIASIQADQLVIKISDTGLGIKEEDLPEVFKDFSKIDKPESLSGSGLNLSLAKRLIELHKGTLTVESTYNQGSEFTITLPLNSRHQ